MCKHFRCAASFYYAVFTNKLVQTTFCFLGLLRNIYKLLCKNIHSFKIIGALTSSDKIWSHVTEAQKCYEVYEIGYEVLSAIGMGTDKNLMIQIPLLNSLMN